MKTTKNVINMGPRGQEKGGNVRGDKRGEGGVEKKGRSKKRPNEGGALARSRREGKGERAEKKTYRGRDQKKQRERKKKGEGAFDFTGVQGRPRLSRESRKEKTGAQGKGISVRESRAVELSVRWDKTLELLNKGWEKN